MIRFVETEFGVLSFPECINGRRCTNNLELIDEWALIGEVGITMNM